MAWMRKVIALFMIMWGAYYVADGAAGYTDLTLAPSSGVTIADAPMSLAVGIVLTLLGVVVYRGRLG